MPDLDIPLPGDVLFFEKADKKDTFGAVISATQKAKGLEHYKFIHAALVVNSDLIVESVTDPGVHKVQLSSPDPGTNPMEYFTATVLRKKSIASLLDHQEVEDIMKAGYYFYKQAYDWKGIFYKEIYDWTGLSKRGVDSDEASICSAFVKKALLQSKQVTGEVFSGFPEQIYPAELYSALIKAGYQPLDGGYDYEAWKKAHIPLDVLKLMEDGHSEHAAWDKFATFLTTATQSHQDYLDRELYTKDADLTKLVSVLEGTGTSLLDTLHQFFESHFHHLKVLERLIQERPKNWRDKLHYRDAVMAKTEIATSHYRSTLNFIGVFMNVLAGETLRNQAVQQQKDWEEASSMEEKKKRLFDTIVQQLVQIFLATRTTELAHVEGLVGESKVKLQAYREGIARLNATNNLGIFSDISEQYETAIDIIETNVVRLNDIKGALGEQVISVLAAEAKNQVEHVWSTLKLRDKTK